MDQCQIAGLCSGCPWITLPLQEQQEKKIQEFHALWKETGLGLERLPSIQFYPIGAFHLRERIDLTLVTQGSLGPTLGLFERERKSILDLPACPQMSKELEDWYLQFKKDLPKIKRGSIRLRVSPDGTKGVWFDLANIDIKNLLDERTYLSALAKTAIIEMGQRRKRVVEKESRLGLGEETLFPWSETYYEGKAYPLFCSIGSFTQVGREANRALAKVVTSWTKNEQVGTWLELGAGAGTLTLPVLAQGNHVTAVEIDRSHTQGLVLSAEKAGVLSQLEVLEETFDFPSENLKSKLTAAAGMIVDPPRSGLGKFISHLETYEQSALPKQVIYVSCFKESLIPDLKRLLALGFEVKEITAVDQFSHSPHCEFLVNLVR